MKPAGYISTILLFLVLFGFGLIYIETRLLEAWPPNISTDNDANELTIGQWIKSFQKWSIFCVGTAGVASLIWYIYAQWFVSIYRWEDTNKRLIWWLWMFITFITIVVSCFYIYFNQDDIILTQVESSILGVYLLFFLNGLLVYYITTLLFSPLSFKYTPIGAKRIRSLPICFW